ncbi:MAG TPA: hypothetical protein V6D05_17300 [Stenomitos sp.]
MPDWRRLFDRLQRLTGPAPTKEVPAEVVRKGYEPSDVNLRVVGIVTVVIVVLALLMHAALLVLLYGLAHQEGEQLPVPAEPPPTKRFPRPALQVDPSEDLARQHAEEEQRLGSYGWVDRSRGVVHIPVQRAMDLLLERGRPRGVRHAP